MRLERMADRVMWLEWAIAKGEVFLKEMRAKLRYYKESVIPDLVDELEWDLRTMSYFPEIDVMVVKLNDGRMITIADAFYPDFPKKDSPRRQEIIDFMESNGGAGLLTLVVTLAFRRGEGAKARTVLSAIDSAAPGITYTKEKGINYQLYQSYCRDRLGKGEDIPDALGLFNRRVAEITPSPEHQARHSTPAVKDVGQGYGD